MKKLILLAAGIMGAFTLYADAPKQAVLATDFQFPMSISGKKIGSVSLKAGSSVCVVSVQGDGILIARGDSDPVIVSKETLTPESLTASVASATPSPVPTDGVLTTHEDINKSDLENTKQPPKNHKSEEKNQYRYDYLSGKWVPFSKYSWRAIMSRGASDSVLQSKEALTPESSAVPPAIPLLTNCIISPSNNQPNEVKIGDSNFFSSSNATNQGYASQIHPRLIFPEKDEVIVVVPNNLNNNTFYEDVKTSNQLPQSQNSEQKIGYSYFYLVGKWEPTLQRAEPRSAIQTQSFEFTRDKYFCWTSSFERNGVTIATTYKYQVIIENNKIKMFNDKATTGFAGRRYEISLPYNPDVLSISFVTKPEANFVQSPSGSLTLKRLEP